MKLEVVLLYNLKVETTRWADELNVVVKKKISITPRFLAQTTIRVGILFTDIKR